MYAHYRYEELTNWKFLAIYERKNQALEDGAVANAGSPVFSEAVPGAQLCSSKCQAPKIGLPGYCTECTVSCQGPSQSTELFWRESSIPRTQGSEGKRRMHRTAFLTTVSLDIEFCVKGLGVQSAELIQLYLN